MFRLSSLAQQQHLHNNNIITAVASNKSEGLVQLSEMETFLTLFGAAMSKRAVSMVNITSHVDPIRTQERCFFLFLHINSFISHHSVTRKSRRF